MKIIIYIIRIGIYLFVVSLFSVFPITAQTLQFKHLGLEKGLSQSTINCILQDSRGFLWLGTQDGLNKYDGYDFVIYRSEQGKSNTLSHDWIWDLY